VSGPSVPAEVALCAGALGALMLAACLPAWWRRLTSRRPAGPPAAAPAEAGGRSREPARPAGARGPVQVRDNRPYEDGPLTVNPGDRPFIPLQEAK
jgi:hypothetical protein